MTITIHLKLFARLARRLPANAESYPPPEGLRVQDLVQALDIRRDEAQLIFINGRRVTPEAILSDGDRVGIFPPVGGG